MLLTLINTRRKLSRQNISRALLAALLMVANLTLAAPAGQVEFAQGVTSAQQPGQALRFLSKGDVLQEGDILNTGAKGFAIIALTDGSKMTLRPNTTFAIDQFNAAAGQETAIFRLLKGGLRAITGTIGKARPDAMRVNTSTATIGIRGTSFDARICGTDCAEDERATAKTRPAAVPDLLVARVIALTGSATVTGANKQTRSVVKGVALYTGDSIRTEKGSYAVLAFRDETRVTVASESEFKLENVRFTGEKADSGTFAVRLLRGTARTFTGLFAKRDPKAFQFSAGTTTIGIRGTGFDTRVDFVCSTPSTCADSVRTFLWDGLVAMEAGNQLVLIPVGRMASYDGLQKLLILHEPDFKFDFFPGQIEPPRPDRIPGDEGMDLVGTPPGVYVNLREGLIEIRSRLNERSIIIEPGQAALFADGSDIPVRLRFVPQFFISDPTPLPDSKFDILLQRLLPPGVSSGGLICEM